MSEPFSLYVHLPWCIKKCPYCDFNSHPSSHSFQPIQYQSALLRDLEVSLPEWENRTLQSIFFGGGTPNLFPPEFFNDFLTRLNELKPYASETETTMEANPGAREAASFIHYRKAGINRLSIGAQTFCDTALKKLGRIHKSREIHQSIEQALTAQFNSINVDLMYGLPGQSVKKANNDLEKLLQYPIQHVSRYQLTLEPNTFFAKNPPTLPVHEKVFEMHQTGTNTLIEHHFHPYEVSAFSKDGNQCKHNLAYWQFQDYLGIGAGAHSKNTNHDNIVHRSMRIKHPQTYIAANSPIATQWTVPQDTILFEFLLNRLRLKRPITWQELADNTHADRAKIERKITSILDLNLVQLSTSSFTLTKQGELFLDDVMQCFLPLSD